MKRTLTLTVVLGLLVAGSAVAQDRTDQADPQKRPVRPPPRAVPPTDEGGALEAVRQAVPITDVRALRTRLAIPAERAGAIVIGEPARDRLIRFLSSTADETGYECKAEGCSCFGDADCNRMFSQVCSDPATNGVCTGEPPVCTCHP